MKFLWEGENIVINSVDGYTTLKVMKTTELCALNN